MTKRAKFQTMSEQTAAAVVQRFDEIERLGQQHLELSMIDVDPDQPRTDFDAEEMAELKASISRHGVLQPILVEALGKRFGLIAGERRLRASRELGLSTIPAVVRSGLSEVDRLDIQLVENLSRDNLNAFDRIEGIIRLIALRARIPREGVIEDLRKRYSDTGVRNEVSPVTDVVLSQFNLALATVYRQYKKIEKMNPVILAAVKSRKLSFTVGAILDAVKNPVDRELLLSICIAERLSKQALELRIKALKSKNPTKLPKQAAKPWDRRYGELFKIAGTASPEVQKWFSSKMDQLETEFRQKVGET
jgi:ParB family transcriptional regulator, chromosome partitioning protein